MKKCVIVFGVLLGVSFAFAQYRDWERGRGRSRSIDTELTDRRGVPDWEIDRQFKSDVFTFVRIRYQSYGRGWGWATDYPDAELNFSFRLQQLTAMKVNPKPIVLDLTDERLFDHPFIYIVEPGGMSLTEEEVLNLRRYLLNGGFLMVDDFWGIREWENFYDEIKRVFPDREPQELPLEHPIFHCVYDLKEKPQLPSINVAHAYRGTGRTWERDDDREPHYKAIFDDKGRMMCIICHNTDNGDGWEREGEDEWYFREFSEKKAYPVGINIVFWAMTN
jgi:hypothetical protein